MMITIKIQRKWRGGGRRRDNGGGLGEVFGGEGDGRGGRGSNKEKSQEEIDIEI